MKDKIVLITGANGGLGTSVMQRFLSAGAMVIGVSRKIAPGDFPGASKFVPMPADLTKPEAARSVTDAVVRQFSKLDVLVHILGGFAGGQSIADTDDETWTQMQSLNLNAAFYVLRAAIPHLRRSGSGRIVAIGSLTAAQPHPGLGAYVVSKAALAMLVQTVAAENKDAGLTANAILPGTMDTPANRKAMPGSDFSKWLPPGEVAELALWLAGDKAGYVTGALIPIDEKNA